MIDEFLTLAEEIKQLRAENKQLRLDKHMLQVETYAIRQDLKEKGIQLKTLEPGSMWSRPLDAYISMVKAARNECGYSHDTYIWNVLSDLEDNLIHFKEIEELYYKQKENENEITEETS